MKKTLSLAGILLMSGCALLNPYESSFSCPESYNGKCVSVQAAYSESSAVSGTSSSPASGRKQDDCSNEISDSARCIEARKDNPLNAAPKESGAYSRYQSALFDKFAGLLKEPVTPIVAPPKTMRVLLLPYTGQDNEFYMLRYVYFFVDEPRWLLGDSVISNEEDE